MQIKVAISIAITLFIGAAICPAIKYALGGFSPEGLTLFIYLIATTTFCIFAYLKKIRLPYKNDVLKLILMGIFCNFVCELALNYGQLTVKAGTVSLLLYSKPFIVAILSVMLLKEKISRKGWVGILISLVGCLVIILGEGHEFNFSIGIALVLLGTFLNSVYYIASKYFLTTYTELELITYINVAGLVPLFMFTPNLISDLKEAAIWYIGAGAAIAIGGLVIDCFLCMYVISKLPASKTATFYYLTPILSIIIAWLWLGEVPTYLTVLGGMCALAGVFLINSYGAITEGDYSFIENKI